MNIRVDLNYSINDGTEVVFRSPVDCSQVTGLKVYYSENGVTSSKEFAFADAHGNNVGDIDHLFAENVVVKVILDVTTGMAFVQNADTNAYLEGRFAEAITHTPQTLPDEQKAQARENIGAIDEAALNTKANVTDVFEVTEQPMYENMLDGVTLINNKALSGSDAFVDYANYTTHTEYIPVKNNSTIRLKNISLTPISSSVPIRIITYNANKEVLDDLLASAMGNNPQNYPYEVLETDENGAITSFVLKNSNALSFMRISVRTADVGENPILTVNQEIVTDIVLGGKLKSNIKVDYSQIENAPENKPKPDDVAIQYPMLCGTWVNMSLLNYSVDNIVSNQNGITCEKYFPVKDFTSDNTIVIQSNVAEGYTLEIGCCFYDENKVLLGSRSGWFNSTLAVKDGATYFRLCMRIKDSTGAYLEGDAENFPLDTMFLIYSKETGAYLGDLKSATEKNAAAINGLKEIAYIDPETNILISDMADLNTLTIATDYNGYYTRKPFNIVHLTDLHSIEGDVKCFANAIKLLESRDELDCMFLTGDLVSSHFSSDNEPLEAEWAKITKDVIFTVGNHDVGNGKLVADSGTDVEVYEKYYAPPLKEKFLKDHFMYDANTSLLDYNAANPSDNPMMNYYVDYPDYLLRVISMYQYNTAFEISDTDATKLVNTRCNKSYKQSDINWLISTLNNTPDGYTVLFMTHEPEAFGNKTNDWHSLMLARETGMWKKEGILTEILTAYKKKETLSKTFTQTGAIVDTLSVNADFTKANGYFGAWIMGHTHDDYVGQSMNGEINVICKTCDNLRPSGQMSSSILRTEGTPNENTINIMSVDTEHRTITIKRIGAKFSRNGDWRNVTCLTY